MASNIIKAYDELKELGYDSVRALAAIKESAIKWEDSANYDSLMSLDWLMADSIKRLENNED